MPRCVHSRAHTLTTFAHTHSLLPHFLLTLLEGTTLPKYGLLPCKICPGGFISNVTNCVPCPDTQKDPLNMYCPAMSSRMYDMDVVKYQKKYVVAFENSNHLSVEEVRH